MKSNENQDSQALHELEWLVRYFREHGREDIAQEILERMMQLRKGIQGSSGGEHSNLKSERNESEAYE